MTRNVRNERKTHHQGTHPAVAAFLSPDVEGFSGVTYQSTADIVSDARTIIESANDAARRSVNTTLVLRSWYLGKRIAEEELKGANRAEYGKQIIEHLPRELKTMGKGFGKQELHKYVQFYRLFPEIVDSLSRQFSHWLSWTHYRELLRVANDDARTWYAREASEQGWSVRTLARNIGTKYYERLLLSDNKKPVEQEMRAKTADYQTREYQVTEFIKDPYIAEFLGFSPDAEVRETDLESAILANLQKFLLEMGKGYAFMGRQYHLRGISGDYYIDLVFYNVILKCYVLVDLKCGPVTHQDIGQMDMYVRMFDDKVRRADDNPTIGIVLTSETSEDIARYSVLHGNDQLYTSSYLLYLPNEEELRRTIETEKQRFVLAAGQTDENGDDC